MIQDVIQRGLCVHLEPLLRGRARGMTVATIREHEDITAKFEVENAGEGDAVTVVSAVTVEHEYSGTGRCELFG